MKLGRIFVKNLNNQVDLERCKLQSRNPICEVNLLTKSDERGVVCCTWPFLSIIINST